MLLAQDYAYPTSPHGEGGFDSSCNQGTEVVCRKHSAFFMPSRFMVGALGSRKARRLLGPVCQPDALTARGLTASVGDLLTVTKESTMNAQSQVTPAFQVANVAIRQDVDGRHCLNDLYKSSGSNPKHKPSEWLRNKQAQELIAEIDLEAGIPAIKTTKGRGITATYVVKELVYAYAMWISPKFHLQVIRAYDALQRPALPAPDANTIEISLNSGVQMMTLVLEGKADAPARYVVDVTPAAIHVRHIPKSSFIATSAELVGIIGEPAGQVALKDLPAIIQAATNRIAESLAFNHIANTH